MVRGLGSSPTATAEDRLCGRVNRRGGLAGQQPAKPSVIRLFRLPDLTPLFRRTHHL